MSASTHRSPRWAGPRAENDEQSCRNFGVTALAELPHGGLRAATVEDARDSLGRITRDVSEATGRQYVLRVKSLLGYAHRLDYAPFNAGATIKVRSDARNRGATLAKRIIPEVEVRHLIHGARTKRYRVVLEVIYAGGLRVSEFARLTWSDVLAWDKGQAQLSVAGKGGVVRQVLLPEAISGACRHRSASESAWLRHAHASPSIAAPRFPRSSQASGTTTSPRRQGTCVRAWRA